MSWSCPELDNRISDRLFTRARMPLEGGFGYASAEAGALSMSVLRSRDDVEFASTESAPVVDAGSPLLSTFESGRFPNVLCPTPAWPGESRGEPLACLWSSPSSCAMLSCVSSASLSRVAFGTEDAVTNDLSLERRVLSRFLGSCSTSLGVDPLGSSASSGSEGASTNSSVSVSAIMSLFCDEPRGTRKAGGVAAVAPAVSLAPLASASSAPSSSSASSSSGWGKLCWKRAEELGPSRPLRRR